MSTDVLITSEFLSAHGLDPVYVKYFEDAYPQGVTYSPKDAPSMAALLAGPAAPFIHDALAVGGALPPAVLKAPDFAFASAPPRGDVTVGYAGVAVAGMKENATAGMEGHALAMAYGTATAGDFGVALSGFEGRSSAGNSGLAFTGADGRVKAAPDGTLVSAYRAPNGRGRLAVAYVGEHAKGLPSDQVIEPNVYYSVDGNGDWHRA